MGEIFIKGAMHPDMFDGESPMIIKADGIPEDMRAFIVESCGIFSVEVEYINTILAKNQGYAESKALYELQDCVDYNDGEFESHIVSIEETNVISQQTLDQYNKHW